ncbi:unnamed protein product [Calypogeia fissa]
MAPENEGKPAVASVGSRTEVSVDELRGIEQLLVKFQVELEGICSTDLSNLSFDCDVKPESQDSNFSQQLNRRPEVLRVLATKQDNVKLISELALLRLRNLIPKEQGPVEEVTSNMNLKRSRPLSPLHVPRIPSIVGALDSKMGVMAADGAGSPRGNHGATDFHGSNPPLKFIRTGDNTKAPFQKPSTIFMPTAKLGAVGVPILDAPIMSAATEALPALSSGNVNKGSPKKRPPRSRRDRNRTKNKEVVMPEPVMMRLVPGDTNKIPDDGFLWRKYGNKPIKTASYKRGYYKCRHFKEVKCNATKIVQQTNNDPNTFSVHYKGEHTCSQRGNLGGASRSSQAGGNDTSSLADQVNENLNSSDARSGDDDKDDVLDGMDWPREDDDSDCGSEEMFTSEGGEDAVESVAAPAAADEIAQPTSPSYLSSLPFEIPPIENLSTDTVHSNLPEINIDTTTTPWCDTLSTPDYKLKYQDSCPPEATQEIDQNEMLLDFINGGLIGDNAIHDYSYWCENFSNFPSDGLPLLSEEIGKRSNSLCFFLLLSRLSISNH